MLFSELGLSPKILRVLSEQGYETPTPIQGQTIPELLKGRDLVGCAQTGTGKTAAFSLPIIQRLGEVNTASTWRKVSALVLTPTRELAMQVQENIETYSRYVPLRSTVIFGGVNFDTQVRNLRKGVHIIVATPGRLLDHLRQRTVDLSGVEYFVLDEADRMLDMGFIRDIKKIIDMLPQKRQNVMFSATFSPEIMTLAREFLHQPAVVEVKRSVGENQPISQIVYPVDRNRKREMLYQLVTSDGWGQTLVFTRTKHGANRLAEQLEQDGIKATAIHGNKSQAARTRALADFKKGAVKILVATDIAARGIDIDRLPHVVNFELPMLAEDYVHRIGRTGRAGMVGEACSLVCVDEIHLLRGIERLLKQNLENVILPGFEVDPSIRPEPILRKPAQRGSSSSRPRTDGRSSSRDSRGPRDTGGGKSNTFRNWRRA